MFTFDVHPIATAHYNVMSVIKTPKSMKEHRKSGTTVSPQEPSVMRVNDYKKKKCNNQCKVIKHEGSHPIRN